MHCSTSCLISIIKRCFCFFLAFYSRIQFDNPSLATGGLSPYTLWFSLSALVHGNFTSDHCHFQSTLSPPGCQRRTSVLLKLFFFTYASLWAASGLWVLFRRLSPITTQHPLLSLSACFFLPRSRSLRRCPS